VATKKLPKRRLQFENCKTASEGLIQTLGEATPEEIDDLIRQLETLKVIRARQPAIEKCMKKAGVYVWHVTGLTVKLDGHEEKWCVVKVGMTMNQPIDSRLKQERRDVTQWRRPGYPRITLNCLEDGRKAKASYVGDLVAIFSGPAWSGSEKEIRRRLGLPLGTGKLVYKPSESAVDQMTEEHPELQDINNKIVDRQGKIQARAWTAYFKTGTGDSKKPVEPSQVGPSELIMMPEAAMNKLRKNFQENPAHFESTFPATNVDGETGPAWKIYIQEAREALPKASDWHKKKHATVQFKKTGLIGPLTLKLWDPEEEKKQNEAKKQKAEPKGSPTWTKRVCQYCSFEIKSPAAALLHSALHAIATPGVIGFRERECCPLCYGPAGECTVVLLEAKGNNPRQPRVLCSTYAPDASVKSPEKGVQFSAKSLQDSTKSAPSTNHPVECPECDRVVWSYNMDAHWELVHKPTPMKKELRKKIKIDKKEMNLLEECLKGNGRQAKCIRALL